MKAKTVVVAGGAGYIGSHMTRLLQDRGYQAVVVDNLSTGHADAVHREAVLQIGQIGDPVLMRSVLREFQPCCVMHFAAASLVGESMTQPSKYWHNNLVQTLSLLDTMRECGVNQFIFSSTAAVYGEPHQVPIAETHPCLPINPYGQSKLAIEKALADYGRAYGLRYTTFRYFNAAGAHSDASLGERHEPETHLIPLVLQVASGQKEAISRFGNDFDTADGSCIRDYVHVQDLATAHLLALQQLLAGKAGGTYNLGNGKGHSVTEVINAARRITGHTIPVRDDPRRVGDPPILVADATQARAVLGWKPQYPDIELIIDHAWRWESALHQLEQFEQFEQLAEP